MKKRLLSVFLAICMILALVPAVFADGGADDVFTMTDFNWDAHFLDGAYSVGWKYASSFERDTITGLKLVLTDAADNVIITYTADETQVAWQQENGYITSDGLSSAPVKKTYPEGADTDWTITYGDAYENWNIARASVTVTASGSSYTQSMDCTHKHTFGADGTCPCGAKRDVTDVFTMTDFNWSDSFLNGAYSVGWKYADTFDYSTISALTLVIRDELGNVIITYSADQEQVQWQQANGYVTSDGLSSAPFYQSYNGTAIKEGRDNDWTVKFGPMFKYWNFKTAYLTVTVGDKAYMQSIECTHTHTYQDGKCECGAIKYTPSANIPSYIPGIIAGGAGSMMQHFVDVTSMEYYYDAVQWAVEHGITEGTGKVTFSPDAPCTRAQAVTFLWRALGCPKADKPASFTDVKYGSYYAEAVAWAVENGVTVGTSATTFSPDAPCTRAQIVTFLYRAIGEESTVDAGFSDVSATAYYADAVNWAAQYGITGGTGANRFSPDMTCTRAQIVTFLYRAN